MYNLFNQFKIISYNGVPVRNLLTKVRFSDVVKKTGAVFYPYVINEGERPDSIASSYYDDPRYSWVIYMSNDIYDPYYDWPLSNKEFNEHLINKYGSLANAQDTIMFWRDNWKNDESIINQGGYNALTSNLKKYYRPVVGYGNSIVHYVRAESDLYVETNQIVEIEVDDITIFDTGNLINQYDGATLIASGQVKSVTSTGVVVNNIQGEFDITTGSIGNLKIKNTSLSSPITVISIVDQSIPLTELVYWEPVDAYTYEFELNESKRAIRLIDKAYIDQIERELSEIL